MAYLVNCQASAYETLDNLTIVHETIINELENELKEIRAIIGEENGFYAENTCRKINTLLDSFEQEILPSIKDSFEITEKGVESMKKILNRVDVF